MMKRREFLGLSALALPTALTAGESAADGGAPVKFCVFADIHYKPGDTTNDTVEFLDKILDRAEKAGCSFVIHLGDMIHDLSDSRQKAYVEHYNTARLPTYHVLGNHDQDGTPYGPVVEAFRMPKNYYFFDLGGFRFIVTDPNYGRDAGGNYVHFENTNYVRLCKTMPIVWIPPEQLVWLKETIDASPYPCVVLSHQSFERPPRSEAGHGVMNGEEVRRIFDAANRKCPGKVRLVMNGHNHVENLRVLENIVYWDVNSANYQCARHKAYPADYVKNHAWAPAVLAWDAPLSAIVTMWPGGRLRIEGSKAGWLFGVTPEKAGVNPYDEVGREMAPVIQSADMTFRYS